MKDFTYYLKKIVQITFIILAIITCSITIIVVVDVLNHYQLDLSYDGCLVFDNKVSILKSYMAATVSVATLLIIIKQKQIDQQTLISSYLFKTCEYKVESVHKIISNDRDIIRLFANQFCFDIAADIYNLNDKHRIQNKKELQKITDKYLKEKIKSFEDYYCKEKYSKRLFYIENKIESYSLQHFCRVVSIIFTVSPLYERFENDFADIYNGQVEIIANSVDKEPNIVVQSYMEVNRYYQE